MPSRPPRQTQRPPRVLVCYYSMTGHTRQLAREIQRRTGAEIEEIAEPHRRHGVLGTVRALVDAVARRQPPLLPVTHDPAAVDLLILGGPVWAGRLASPVRAYAARHACKAPRVAFFCTEGAHGADGAFADLEALCGRERVAALAVDQPHRDPDAHGDALDGFIKALPLPRADGAAQAALGMASHAS